MTPLVLSILSGSSSYLQVRRPTIKAWMSLNFVNSQMHYLQKLKNISLKAVNYFRKKSKVTCLSESVFFHLDVLELQQFSRSGV